MFYILALLFGGLAVAASASGSSGSTGAAAAPEEDETPPLAEGPAPAPPEPESSGDETPLVVDEGGDDGFTSSSGAPTLPDSAYDIGWVGLSAEEQLIVELINRARLDPLAEVDRLNEGLAAGISTSPVEALAVVPTLSDAAEAHSEDMDDRDFFDHINPEGQTPWDRAVEDGHSNSFVGENIGWIGSTNTSFDIQARAEAHHTNLWESDGHQQNLMSGNWSEIGLGYDYGSYRGYDGSTFVTELFGDTGKSYLTGVVIEDGDDDGFYDIGEGQGDVRITAYNDDQAYATATWDSGGYSLALPPGTYKVVFEGGDLDAPYETEVTIGGDNVKLDVIDEGGNSVMTLSAGAATEPMTTAELPMLPPVEDIFIPEEIDEAELLMA